MVVMVAMEVMVMDASAVMPMLNQKLMLMPTTAMEAMVDTEDMVDTDMVVNAVLLMLSQKLKLMPTTAMEAMADMDTAANADLLSLKLPQLHTTDMVDTEDTVVMEVMVATEDTDMDIDVKILSFLKIVNKHFPSHLNIRRRNCMLVR